MNPSPDIIIIRGAPGSGKSLTAKSLSQYFPKGVRMEVDTIRQMVVSVDWKNQQEHINMLQVSIKLVLEFLHFGFNPVIVIDTFSGDKLDHYLKTLYDYNENLIVKLFGLYTADEELKKRLEMRISPEFNDFPICKKLNDDVLKWKHHSEFQLDTTGLTQEHSAEIIYRQLI